jgi:hypothetical protein
MLEPRPGATSPLRNSKAILNSFTCFDTIEPDLNQRKLYNNIHGTNLRAHLETRPLIERFDTGELMGVNPEYKITSTRTSAKCPSRSKKQSWNPPWENIDVCSAIHASGGPSEVITVCEADLHHAIKALRFQDIT